MNRFFCFALSVGIVFSGVVASAQTITLLRGGVTTQTDLTTGVNSFLDSFEPGDVFTFYQDVTLSGRIGAARQPTTMTLCSNVPGTQRVLQGNGSHRFVDGAQGSWVFTDVAFKNFGGGSNVYGAVLWQGDISVACSNVLFEGNFGWQGGVLGQSGASHNMTLSGKYTARNNRVTSAKTDCRGGMISSEGNVTLNGDGSTGIFTGNGYAASRADARSTANDIYAGGQVIIHNAGTYTMDGGIVALKGLTIGDDTGSATNVTFQTGAINTITGDLTIKSGATVTYESGVTQTVSGAFTNDGTLAFGAGTHTLGDLTVGENGKINLTIDSATEYAKLDVDSITSDNYGFLNLVFGTGMNPYDFTYDIFTTTPTGLPTDFDWNLLLAPVFRNDWSLVAQGAGLTLRADNAGNVPEPGAWTLLALGVVFLWRKRRHVL